MDKKLDKIITGKIYSEVTHQPIATHYFLTDSDKPNHDSAYNDINKATFIDLNNWEIYEPENQNDSVLFNPEVPMKINSTKELLEFMADNNLPVYYRDNSNHDTLYVSIGIDSTVVTINKDLSFDKGDYRKGNFIEKHKENPDNFSIMDKCVTGLRLSINGTINPFENSLSFRKEGNIAINSSYSDKSADIMNKPFMDIILDEIIQDLFNKTDFEGYDLTGVKFYTDDKAENLSENNNLYEFFEQLLDTDKMRFENAKQHLEIVDLAKYKDEEGYTYTATFDYDLEKDYNDFLKQKEDVER